MFSSSYVSGKSRAAWRICPLARKRHLEHHCSAGTRPRINSPNIQELSHTLAPVLNKILPGASGCPEGSRETSWRLPPNLPGKVVRAGLGLLFLQGCMTGVTLSPENLIQSHQPHAGSVANLRMCLLPEPVWFLQAVQITASSVHCWWERWGEQRGRKGVLEKSLEIYVFFLSAGNFFLWSKLWISFSSNFWRTNCC